MPYFEKLKYIYLFLIFVVGILANAQDISMTDGTFNRCAPDLFYDSGGEFGNYSNNENITTTICPQNPDDFIILNF